MSPQKNINSDNRGCAYPVPKYIPSSLQNPQHELICWMNRSKYRRANGRKSLRKTTPEGVRWDPMRHKTANISTPFYRKSVFNTIIWMLQHKGTPPPTSCLHINREIKHCINLCYSTFADLLVLWNKDSSGRYFKINIWLLKLGLANCSSKFMNYIIFQISIFMQLLITRFWVTLNPTHWGGDQYHLKPE